MIEPHMYFTEFAPRNKRRLLSCAIGDLVYPKATTGKAKQSRAAAHLFMSQVNNAFETPAVNK